MEKGAKVWYNEKRKIKTAGRRYFDLFPPENTGRRQYEKSVVSLILAALMLFGMLPIR